MDYTKRLEELEQTRTDFGRKIQAFEQDFGHSSYLNRAPTIEDPRKLENARILVDRYALIDLLPKGGLVAEVGVDRGQFSHKILASSKPSELYLIDSDLSRLDSENEEQFKNIGNVHLIEGRSEAVLLKMKHGFSWIYIDGDHSYTQVQKDIAVAAPLISPEGFLVFNDYTLWSPANMKNYGVSRAVNEFVNMTTEWRVEYFAFQSGGYHDIALKRVGQIA